MKKLLLPIALLNFLLITGCTSVATNPEEITEQSLLQERRNRETILMDKGIEAEAYSELSSEEDILNQCHVTITAYNGAALITGESPNEELKKKIISIVQVVPNVKLIHDNLSIANPSDSSSRANDQLITDTIRTALSQIRTMPDFDPAMVKVITENGTVYLMGFVRRDEGAVVINVTKLQPGIKQIITVFEYAD
ncbi:MAG: BON domain-containing protein [Methylococcales bacterium]|nr:BON domain-containing protein [Methylococcales bacterium]